MMNQEPGMVLQNRTDSGFCWGLIHVGLKFISTPSTVMYIYTASRSFDIVYNALNGKVHA